MTSGNPVVDGKTKEPELPEQGQAVQIQPEPVQKIIKNMTARRIGIGGNTGQLIIPPFGSIILDEQVLKDYPSLKTWEQRNLITNEAVPVNAKDDIIWAVGCLWAVVYLFFLVVSLVAAVIFKAPWGFSTAWIGTVIFGGITLLGALIVWAKKWDNASKLALQQYWQWFLMLPSLILVLAIGLGLPVGVVYYFGSGSELLAKTSPTNLLALGRVLQLGFVAIASMMPALMYFLFSRQQIEKLRDNFIKEVMMLDPNVQTISEAKTKYNPLFDSVYSDKTPLDSIPIFFCTILIAFGWIITLLPIGQLVPAEGKGLLELLTPYVTAHNFGFLGAYLFSINMIFRRYVRSDITTKTYTAITIRFLVTAILVWVTAPLLTLMFGDVPATKAATLVLAFFTGIVPETSMAVLQEMYRKSFGKVLKLLDEEHPLTNLEGINLYDRAHLMEQGIENIENLAHHNLLELVVKTHIPTPRIVDMFDQAILYLHLGLKSDELMQTREVLRTYGIRTATDLQAVKELLPDILKDKVAPDLLNRLKVIAAAFADDEWLSFVHHWRHTSTSLEIYSLDNFIDGRPENSPALAGSMAEDSAAEGSAGS